MDYFPSTKFNQFTANAILLSASQCSPLSAKYCSKPTTNVQPLFLCFATLYSFYQHANHYWDFSLPDKIVDNITSKQGKFKRGVEVTRSLTGTGLRTEDSSQIILEPGAECPVEPSKCTNGLTVSVFLKVVGTFAQFEDHRFLLGNAVNEQKTGFFVGISERELKIFVKTDDYVCSCFDVPAMANVWFYLGFSWKDPDLPYGGLTVYIDRKKVGADYVRCERSPGMRSTFTKIELGSHGESNPAVEFDNLAIWYQKLNRIAAPWYYVTGKCFLLFLNGLKRVLCLGR